MTRRPVLVSILAVLFSSACGAPSSQSAVLDPPAGQTVTVQTLPIDVSVAPGATFQFSAQVTGTSDTSVVWSVAEAGGGMVDAAGLYTAPAIEGTFHVRADSAMASVKSFGTSVVHVTSAPRQVAVAVNPPTATVPAGGSFTFAAAVTGSTVGTVIWTVQEGSSCGSVSSTGAYTAPTSASTCHVVATSAADTTKSGSATVTVTAAPVVTVSVSPTTTSMTTGGTRTFSATVSGTTAGQSTAVTWSVPAGAGSIGASTGVYVAPATAGTYVVTATSVAAPTEIGTATVTVTAPPSDDVLANLLNFAETWNRNWNFGGHTVTDAFTSDQGRWDYTDTTYEPWLFDRATVGYRLFEMTGNTRWRDQFLVDFAFYRAHIDAQGIFTPKGSGDTKYGYVTPFVLYEKATGDQQYRPIARRIYDSWIREWPNDFQPNASMWTERELAFALEAAVAWYEMTGEAAALTRSAALVNQWTVASGSVGAPLVTYTQHEGGGPGGTTPTNLTNSPWMSALYFQAARRYYEISNSSEVLAQASRYADWLNANAFYDAALVHPQYAGLVFPRYLTGELIGDAGYDYGNMAHCLDVGAILKFALFAKQQRGESQTTIQNRYNQMRACASADFVVWTRTADYLPMYRINPPRKFNWQLRGYYEDVH
jgi:hypothetical protein